MGLAPTRKQEAVTVRGAGLPKVPEARTRLATTMVDWRDMARTPCAPMDAARLALPARGPGPASPPTRQTSLVRSVVRPLGPARTAGAPRMPAARAAQDLVDWERMRLRMRWRLPAARAAQEPVDGSG